MTRHAVPLQPNTGSADKDARPANMTATVVTSRIEDEESDELSLRVTISRSAPRDGRAQRQERGQRNALAGRPEHQNDAEQTDTDRAPTAPSDLLAQHGNGKRGAQQRRREGDGERIGNRHQADRGHEQEHAGHDDRRAQRLAAHIVDPQTGERSLVPGEQHDRRKDEDRPHEHDLSHRIIRRQPFQDAIVEDDKRTARDHADDSSQSGTHDTGC